jgi:hypothetical protein
LSTSLEFLAVLTAGLFAGAALYINLAEQPARLTLETRQAVLQWGPSYQRATWLQAPLAVVSCICGITVWLLAGDRGWLVGALLIGAVVPVTLLVIMPTNRQLLDDKRDPASPAARTLLVRWGHLHALRTVLSLAGVIVYLWRLVAVCSCWRDSWR